MSGTLFETPTTEAKMTTDLVERPATELTPLAMIQAAVQQGLDPAQLEKLMDLEERWQANQAADAFARALAAFQADCPPIKKERQIDLGQGKGPSYASYDDIMAVIAPLLKTHGLAITFTTDITAAGQMHVQCRVRHGRHIETTDVTLPTPANMRVNDTQKMGAAMKYGMRYALCAALNVVVTDEDRDGEGLHETVTEEQLVTLREWIDVSGADEARFLTTYQINSLAEMPATMFLTALGQLKRKAAKK